MRLVSAEVLKISKRRGLMIWSAILTFGVIAVVEIVLTILHAVNPDHHGPAGGLDNFRGAEETLAVLGTLVAVLIGATAGSQDVANGVFRDLVVTGRKRGTLFLVRLPGSVLVLLPLLAVTFVLALVWSLAFAGDLRTPSAGLVGHELVYVLAFTVVNLVIAVGFAAFVSSRIVIGVLIAWNTAVSHILISFSSLGGARKFIDVAAAEHFLPGRNENGVPMSDLTAALVLVGWAAAFTIAGRWWTERRDA
jgi:hypothetical protein